MNTPTPAARALLRKLETLADRGMPEEADNAAHKLARLKARYDFSIPDPDDIFSNVILPCRGDVQEIASFDGLPGVAECCKWILENRYRLEGVFRQRPGEPLTLWLGVDRRTLAGARAMVEGLRDAIGALWLAFLKLPNVTERDSTEFLCGLYDSIMEEERAEGSIIPQRSPVKVPKGRSKAKALSHPVGVAIRPYSIAVELGRKIRLSAPTQELISELREREEVARLAMAA